MWDAIGSRGTEVRFDAGDTLLFHGDESRQCYAIVEGEVLVTATTASGATVVLGRRGAGSVVGELAALEGTPRSATVQARTNVVARVLQPAELQALLLEEPTVALAELRRLSRQLRELTERYAVRSDELRSRIMQLLETHCSETGDRRFSSTREELAGWVGATREAVSRSLRELENEGLIVLGRGSVALVCAGS